jgi:hypothetical protein
MEETCKKDKCFMWKTEGENCPFFIQTIWTKQGSHQPKVLDDCSPRRNTILLMSYTERAIGIQKDYEEQRNKYEEVLEKLGEVFNEMQRRNDMLEKTLQITDEETKINKLFHIEK